jgi:hypothetical protein
MFGGEMLFGYLFVVNLKTLSVAWTIWILIIGWLVKN